MALDLKRALALPEAELRALYLATFVFLAALARPRYRKAVKAVSQQLRVELHARPNRGRYVAKGRRRKLAVNLRLAGVPDLPRRAAIAIDVKAARTRRLPPI